MRRHEPLSNAAFLARVSEYLFQSVQAWEIDREGKACQPATQLYPDVFYCFDSDYFEALTYAVEDQALEEAAGSLLAILPDFSHYPEHQERFWQLGATLDRVEVWAPGPLPRQQGRLEFSQMPEEDNALAGFRVMVFQGAVSPILLMGRGEGVDYKRFLACYSFDPVVVAEVRQELDCCQKRQSFGFCHWQRLRRIDQACRQMEEELGREEVALKEVYRRFMRNPSQFPQALPDGAGPSFSASAAEGAESKIIWPNLRKKMP